MGISAATRQHAIVIGGSVAGLLAARVLSDHFARVTLLDRDQFPEDPVFRPGVPQARHLHVLLVRGQRLLEELLPGLTETLVAHGIQVLDFINDGRLNFGGNWAPRFPSDIRAYSGSRPFIEWAIRRAVLSRANITVLPQHEVVGVIASSTGRQVLGVKVRPRGLNPVTDPATALEADLVVDASGRRSRAMEWLESLGYPRPTQITIDPHVGYASQVVRLSPHLQRSWKGLYLMATPPDTTCGGAVAPLEGGERWIVTLLGSAGQYPPTERDGFLEFARALAYPDLYDAIKDAEPLSPIYGYRDTSNQLHRFEKMRTFPDSFVVLGDAVAAFNPVYGQGMTVAALGARELDRQLRALPSGTFRGFGRRFQRALARQVSMPWRLAITADVSVPGVTGARANLTAKLLGAYLRRVFQVIPDLPRAQITFIRVVNMISSPVALFHPAILARALLIRRKSPTS